MMRRLCLIAAFSLPALSFADASGPEAQKLYQADIDSRAAYRRHDTVDSVRSLLNVALRGSPEERFLTYRLAAVYYRQLQVREAEALLAKFLYPEKKSTPPIQTMIAAREPLTWPQLRYVLRSLQQQDPQGALALAKASLPLYERSTAFPVKKPSDDLAELHSAVAELHHAGGQLEEAESHYRKSLAIFGRNGTNTGLSHVFTRAGLAALLREKGSPAQALPLQETALAELRILRPAMHRDLREGERELAYIHAQLGNHPRAAALFEGNIKTARAAGADAAEVAQDLDALADMALVDGNYAAAAPYLLRKLALHEASLPVPRQAVALTLQRLAEVYSASGQVEKLRAIRKRQQSWGGAAGADLR